MNLTRCFTPTIFILSLISSLFFLTGCHGADDGARNAPGNAPQFYAGLAGQSVAVMVWADRGIRIDWPSVQLDLANQVQEILSKADTKEVKKTTWPVQPASIVRYQRDHPGIEASPVTDIAPRFGVTRLIYIEMSALSTRSDSSLQLFRGNAVATMKVIEVNNGIGKLVFEDRDIRAVFPPNSPPEGKTNSNDAVMYKGSVATMAVQVARRLASISED